jgi:branched-chain amino acid transport system permease protein
MHFDFLIAQLLNGLIISSIYALMAVGLSLIFGVLKLVNFSHGELYMLGGFSYYYLSKSLNFPPLLALLSTAVILFLIGGIIERTLLRLPGNFSVDRKDEYTILITFGLSIFIQNLALALFGPWNKSPVSILPGRVTFGDLIIGGDRLIAFGIGMAIIFSLILFLGHTFFGWAIRAVSQDSDASAITGIEPTHINLITFGLGCALAGVAGALIGPIFLVHPAMGTLPVVKAFVIIVLGGMGSVKGSILGAVILGEVESLGTIFFPDPTRAMAYKDAYGLLILIVVLVLRPSGLFGERGKKG